MAAGGDLVTALESSLQGCVSALLVNDHVEKEGKLEDFNKSGVEAAVGKFLESAKNLEGEFLRRQMYSTVHCPEEEIKEEIQHMKAELEQKQELINSLSQKVDHWMKVMQDRQQTHR